LGRVPVGLGLVGCGVIAETYAGALSSLDGARLVAVTDVDAPRGERFAAAHGVAHDPSLEVLLARDEVDVVCVCVPSGRHAEVGLAAARAGPARRASGPKSWRRKELVAQGAGGAMT
jgi:predicted dehydrogenase